MQAAIFLSPYYLILMKVSLRLHQACISSATLTYANLNTFHCYLFKASECKKVKCFVKVYILEVKQEVNVYMQL